MSREYDAKADLWSIGTIIYQCLTGRAPFLVSVFSLITLQLPSKTLHDTANILSILQIFLSGVHSTRTEEVLSKEQKYLA